MTFLVQGPVFINRHRTFFFEMLWGGRRGPTTKIGQRDSNPRPSGQISCPSNLRHMELHVCHCSLWPIYPHAKLSRSGLSRGSQQQITKWVKVRFTTFSFPTFFGFEKVKKVLKVVKRIFFLFYSLWIIYNVHRKVAQRCIINYCETKRWSQKSLVQR